MSDSPNPLFQILPAAKEESAYRYNIRLDDLDFSAYLTYEVPRVSDDRTLLLVNVEYAFINDDHKEEYNRFIERIRESAGRFTGAKNIVNRLAEKEFNKLPNVRIAVHKFGPVPVYVLPQEYQINNLGRMISAKIAVYPDVKSQTGSRKSAVNLNLPFLSTRTEFVRSLNIGLGLMFLRYLEDVAESMFDIEFHLNLAGVFERAKEIETELGESIKTKLDAAIPTTDSFFKPNNDHDRLVNALFEKEKDWLFMARYARQYALFFLNELYSHIAMDSRSEEYFEGFRGIQQQFDGLLGEGHYAGFRERLRAVATLSKTIRAYRDQRYDEIDQIDLTNEPLWTRRFVQFGRFIASLNRVKVNATAGRIFISHHNDVPVTELLNSQIQDFIKTEFGDRVHVLSVRETAAGAEFKEPIRSSIWMSDMVKGIVPQHTLPVGGDQVKDYQWIAREVEYALLLGKRVIYLVEKDLDDKAIRSDLKRTEFSLIPDDARVPTWLPARLLNSFTEKIHPSFTIDHMGATKDDLDPKLKPIIKEVAEFAIERRHQDILVGFHQQFPEAIRRTLRHIQETVPYPSKATKKALALKLHNQYPSNYGTEKSAARAITKAWDLSRKRTLSIDGKPVALMRLNKGHYSGNLRYILTKLRPEWDKSHLEQWERRILLTSPTENEPFLA